MNKERQNRTPDQLARYLHFNLIHRSGAIPEWSVLALPSEEQAIALLEIQDAIGPLGPHIDRTKDMPPAEMEHARRLVRAHLKMLRLLLCADAIGRDEYNLLSYASADNVRRALEICKKLVVDNGR